MKNSKNNLSALFVISIFLILILILSGCRGVRQKPGVTMKFEEVHKGTEGLTMESVKDMLPGEITSGTESDPTEFNIGLKLENKGAYSIRENEGKVMISGLNPEYFEFTPKDGHTQSFKIDGRTPYSAQGGIEYLYFIIKNTKFTGYEKGRKINDTVLARATACFKYQTIASASLCIKPQITYPGMEKGIACEVKPITLSGGQGAPIGITKIEPSIVIGAEKEHNLKLKIYVKDFGAKGHVFPEESYADPSKPCADYENEGKIFINPWNIQISEMPVDECRQEKIFLSKPKEAFFECELSDLDVSMGAYTAPLVITLDYSYSFDVTKPISIRKSEEE